MYIHIQKQTDGVAGMFINSAQPLGPRWMSPRRGLAKEDYQVLEAFCSERHASSSTNAVFMETFYEVFT